MTLVPANAKEAVDRFGVKAASLATIIPSVALPALGAFAGRRLAPQNNELGALLGGITGGVAGQEIKEMVEQRRRQMSGQVPMGAPYALDPSMQDIPPWALQGAQYLRGSLKQSAHKESPLDILLGEVPGANVVQEGVRNGLGAGARAFAGTSLGGVTGGLLGMGVGKGIERLIGHGQPVNIPGVGMSLSDLTAALGGTIGATKGLRYMRA